MGLVFKLLSEDTVIVQDPAGGEFSYCGDIDRLLPLSTELPLNRGFELEVLGRVEAFEDVEFTQEEMPALLRDLAALRSLARPGPELHGLDRLAAMAECCAQLPGSRIRSVGD